MTDFSLEQDKLIKRSIPVNPSRTHEFGSSRHLTIELARVQENGMYLSVFSSLYTPDEQRREIDSRKTRNELEMKAFMIILMQPIAVHHVAKTPRQI